MIEPDELLATARQLLMPNGTSGVSQSCLRRSISTAYYALFHHVLSSAANRLIGIEFRGKSAAYSLVYRSINHSRIADTCRKIDQRKLSPTLQDQLGREAVSRSLRDYATSFLTLLELRELADYEPAGDYTIEDAEMAIAGSQRAIIQWNVTPESERTDILALLLANARR